MSVRYGSVLIFALALSACGKDHQPDVLGGAGGKVSYAVATCTAKDKNGLCLQATCKADEKSDCTQFADICLEYDHHYAGTKEGGTCSQIL